MQRTASDDCTDAERPPLIHGDDCELVGRLLRGEADAWQDFVQQYGRVVRSRVADVAFAFGRATDDWAIDDATAEVFAALLANDAAALRAFAGRSSLVTYLAVIATRCTTRGFARNRFNARGDNALVADEPSAAADEPVRRIIRQEQHQQLLSVLSELPEKQQQVVRLYHLKGRSYAEISTLLEMPIGSIGVTLRRAEEKLRARLDPDLFDSS